MIGYERRKEGKNKWETIAAKGKEKERKRSTIYTLIASPSIIIHSRTPVQSYAVAVMAIIFT